MKGTGVKGHGDYQNEARKQSQMIFKVWARAIVGSDHSGRTQRRLKRFLGIKLSCEGDEEDSFEHFE